MTLATKPKMSRAQLAQVQKQLAALQQKIQQKSQENLRLDQELEAARARKSLRGVIKDQVGAAIAGRGLSRADAFREMLAGEEGKAEKGNPYLIDELAGQLRKAEMAQRQPPFSAGDIANPSGEDTNTAYQAFVKKASDTALLKLLQARLAPREAYESGESSPQWERRRAMVIEEARRRSLVAQDAIPLSLRELKPEKTTGGYRLTDEDGKTVWEQGGATLEVAEAAAAYFRALPNEAAAVWGDEAKPAVVRYACGSCGYQFSNNYNAHRAAVQCPNCHDSVGAMKRAEDAPAPAPAAPAAKKKPDTAQSAQPKPAPPHAAPPSPAAPPPVPPKRVGLSPEEFLARAGEVLGKSGADRLLGAPPLELHTAFLGFENAGERGKAAAVSHLIAARLLDPANYHYAAPELDALAAPPPPDPLREEKMRLGAIAAARNLDGVSGSGWNYNGDSKKWGDPEDSRILELEGLGENARIILENTSGNYYAPNRKIRLTVKRGKETLLQLDPAPAEEAVATLAKAADALLKTELAKHNLTEGDLPAPIVSTRNVPRRKREGWYVVTNRRSYGAGRFVRLDSGTPVVLDGLEGREFVAHRAVTGVKDGKPSYARSKFQITYAATGRALLVGNDGEAMEELIDRARDTVRDKGAAYWLNRINYEHRDPAPSHVVFDEDDPRSLMTYLNGDDPDPSTTDRQAFNAVMGLMATADPRNLKDFKDTLLVEDTLANRDGRGYKSGVRLKRVTEDGEAYFLAQAEGYSQEALYRPLSARGASPEEAITALASAARQYYDERIADHGLRRCGCGAFMTKDGDCNSPRHPLWLAAEARLREREAAERAAMKAFDLPQLEALAASPEAQTAEYARAELQGRKAQAAAQIMIARRARGSTHSAVPGVDFSMTDAIAAKIDQGGEADKIRRNIAAIELSMTLQAEGRLATPQEQETLALYAGWGFMGNKTSVFHPAQGQWDGTGKKPKYFDYYHRVKELLTGEKLDADQFIKDEKYRAEWMAVTSPEYEAAEKSTVNAHYTSPVVVDAMWKAARRLGFRGGDVLEPAVGIGNFISRMPEDLAVNSERHAVELDTVTAGIFRALHPNADMQNTGFQRAKLPDSKFALVTSNVPFGNFPVYDAEIERECPQATESIHNYFFAKALKHTRPGGVVAFVTSKFTLDAPSRRETREYLASQADLLGAIRLPRTAFEGTAGTSVTTDIIFLRKRGEGDPPADTSWVDTTTIKGADENDLGISNWYAAHPKMMLGEWKRGDMYRDERSEKAGGEVYPRAGDDLGALLDEAIAKLPEGALQARCRCGAFLNAEGTHEGDCRFKGADDAPAVTLDGVEQGQIVAAPDGRLYRYDDRQGLVAVDFGKFDPVNSMRARRMRGLAALRPAARRLLLLNRSNVGDDELRKAQAELSDAYDNFVREFGYISQPANRRLLRGDGLGADPDMGLLMALEDGYREEVVAEGKSGKLKSPKKKYYARKAAIFSERLVRSSAMVDSADTALDALLITLREQGKIDFGRMAGLTGRSPEEVREDLCAQDKIFKNPAVGEWETADAYLSGNVRTKLKTARQWAERDPAYRANVAVLEAALPADIPAESITAKPGVGWLPREIMEGVVKELMGEGVPLRRASGNGRWTLNADGARREALEMNETLNLAWGLSSKHQSFTGFDVIETALRGKPIKFRRPKMEDVLDGKGEPVYETVADEKTGEPVMETVALAEGVKQRRPKMRVKQRAVMTTDKDGKSVPIMEADPEGNAVARRKADELRAKFTAYWRDDPARAELVMRTFNDKMNSFVRRQWDGAHYKGPNGENLLPGIGADIPTLYDHQVNVMTRGLQQGNLYMAHIVGSGKTRSAIGTGMEMTRTGGRDQAWYVVPNHLLEQWAGDVQAMYPGARYLAVSKEDLKSANYAATMSRLLTGKYDAVIVTHSGFERIRMRESTVRAHMEGEIAKVREHLKEQEAIDPKSKTVKEAQKTLLRLETRMEKAIAKATKHNKAGQVFFEDLVGSKSIQMFVDEFQAYKNLYFFSEMESIAGLSRAASERADDMYLKSRFVMDTNRMKALRRVADVEGDAYRQVARAIRDGREGGAEEIAASYLENKLGYERAEAQDRAKTYVLAAQEPGLGGGLTAMSGTPIANTMAEMFTNMRYLQEDRLRELDLDTFDSWADAFGDTKTELETNPSGEGWRVRTVFSKWNNATVLLDIASEVMDVQMDDVKLGIQRPPILGGQVEAVGVERSEAQAFYTNHLDERAKHLDPKDKRNDNMLLIMSEARAAALDMRVMAQMLLDRPVRGLDGRPVKKPNPQTGRPEVVRRHTLEEVKAKVGLALTKEDAKELEKEAAKRQKGEKIKRPYVTTPERLYGMPLSELEAIDTPDKLMEVLYNPQGKVEQALRAVVENHKKTTGAVIHHPDGDITANGAQVLFCDVSVPRKDGGFSLYQFMKRRLVEAGIPEKDIAFIQDYDTDAQKRQLFAEINAGTKRVLIASRPKAGAGTNIQSLLYAKFDLDVPYRPVDVEQSDGRIHRPGNKWINPATLADGTEQTGIDMRRFVTKSTLENLLTTMVRRKANMIKQIINNDLRLMSFEDVAAENIDYAMWQAMSSGNEDLMEMVMLDQKVTELSAVVDAHRNRMAKAAKELADMPLRLAETEALARVFRETAQETREIRESRSAAGVEAERRVAKLAEAERAARAKRDEAEAIFTEAKARVKELEKAHKGSEATEEPPELAQARGLATERLAELEQEKRNVDAAKNELTQARAERDAQDGVPYTLGGQSFDKQGLAGLAMYRALHNLKQSFVRDAVEGEVGQWMGLPVFGRVEKVANATSLSVSIELPSGKRNVVDSGSHATMTAINQVEFLGEADGQGIMRKMKDAMYAPDVLLDQAARELESLRKREQPLRNIVGSSLPEEKEYDEAVKRQEELRAKIAAQMKESAGADMEWDDIEGEGAAEEEAAGEAEEEEEADEEE